MSDKLLIAFYGIFRKDYSDGYDNHCTGDVHVGKGKTVENYDSFNWHVDIGRNNQGYSVVVDVYEVLPENLPRYDSVEGYRGPGENNWYERSIVPVQLDSGEVVNCWIYHQHHAEEGEPIIGGDFLAWRKKTRSPYL